jgi:hypothetical protein
LGQQRRQGTRARADFQHDVRGPQIRRVGQQLHQIQIDQKILAMTSARLDPDLAKSLLEERGGLAR